MGKERYSLELLKAVNIRLPESMYRELRVESAKLGVSMSSVARMLLQSWLQGEIEVSVKMKEVE